MMKKTKTKLEQKTNKIEELIKQTITNKYSRHHYCEGIEIPVSIPDELDRRKVDKIIIAL